MGPKSATIEKGSYSNKVNIKDQKLFNYRYYDIPTDTDSSSFRDKYRINDGKKETITRKNGGKDKTITIDTSGNDNTDNDRKFITERLKKTFS